MENDGLTKEEAEKIVEREFGKSKWILTSCGNKLIYGLDDYDASIWLNERKNQKYKAEIILDDGMGMPAVVTSLEAESLDELKKKVELEIDNRIKIRNFI